MNAPLRPVTDTENVSIAVALARFAQERELGGDALSDLLNMVGADQAPLVRARLDARNPHLSG